MKQSFMYVLTSMVPLWIKEMHMIRRELVCVISPSSVLFHSTFIYNKIDRYYYKCDDKKLTEQLKKLNINRLDY